MKFKKADSGHKIDWNRLKKSLTSKCSNCERNFHGMMLAVANQFTGIVVIF